MLLEDSEHTCQFTSPESRKISWDNEFLFNESVMQQIVCNDPDYAGGRHERWKV